MVIVSCFWVVVVKSGSSLLDHRTLKSNLIYIYILDYIYRYILDYIKDYIHLIYIYKNELMQ